MRQVTKEKSKIEQRLILNHMLRTKMWVAHITGDHNEAGNSWKRIKRLKMNGLFHKIMG